MRILLINHYAGSIYHGMEFRPYYLSREWVKMGHEVTIVAASFSHLRQQNIEMNTPIKEEYIDGIRYVWFKTPEYKGNGVARVKNMLSFITGLYRNLKSITVNFVPDAVIASSTYPLDSYPANWIAKKHGAKFVFELHDMWPMSPMVLGNMSKWHPFIWIMQRGEDYWCKNADLVVSLLPDAYKHLVTRGMDIKKFTVVPNGVDVDEWSHAAKSLPKEHSTCINELRKDKRFLVAYVGGHGVSNGLDFLLDTAKALLNAHDVSFIFVGQGPEKDRLEQRSAEEKIVNISFLPPIPKNVIPTLMCKVDLLVCCCPETPLSKYGMSLNKIYDYMMSEKPVLWAANVSNNIIEESRCGWTISPGKPEAMAEKILDIKSTDAELLQTMGYNGRQYIFENLQYSLLAQNFIKYISVL